MDPLLIAVLAIVVMIAAILFLWPMALGLFARSYYKQQYLPIAVKKSPIQDYPPEYHLNDVPWITAPLQVCQSTSLQMIAEKNGIHYPRPNFDFLMAFTYGSSNLPGAGFSPFGTDPEIGFLTAAPYLSLKRCYYTCDDEKLFAAALRSFLSKGFPIRLAVDEGTLYAQKTFIAHSEVLVGYDENGFYYYETVGLPPATTEPGQRPPGENGIFISDEKLLAAVRRFADNLKYPWKYSFTIFEPAALQEDLRPVWLMLGKSMADEVKYGPRMGSKVIEELAARLDKEWEKFDLSLIESGVTLAAQLRQDNAGFLRTNFPSDLEILESAQLLEEAAGHYQEVMAEIQCGIDNREEAKRVALHLADAAAAERKAGIIFLSHGETD